MCRRAVLAGRRSRLVRRGRCAARLSLGAAFRRGAAACGGRWFRLRLLPIPELTAIFRELAVKDKCANWNLVSPTPYLPFIREAVAPLLADGIRLPFVWNSSGYERVETLEEYGDLCDWALFDLRYSRNETALAASAAPNYVEASRAAVKWAWSRRGAFAPSALVPSPSAGAWCKVPSASTKHNLIVRILVLPGHADEAIENLAWLATEVSNEVAVSVMAQYTPAYKGLETPPFDRPVTKDEYESVVEIRIRRRGGFRFRL